MVVDGVVVVVVEEDEGSRMARSTELIFGFLFRLSLICYYLWKNPSSFQAQVGVSFSIASASWYVLIV